MVSTRAIVYTKPNAESALRSDLKMKRLSISENTAVRTKLDCCLISAGNPPSEESLSEHARNLGRPPCYSPHARTSCARPNSFHFRARSLGHL